MDLNLAWPLPHGDEVRDRLLSAYADPTRGYHDLRHLSEVCARLDELAAAGTEFDRVAVGLAAWFHDAVYDALPGAEERSAAWAEHELGALGLDPAIVEEVARLVRLTETHRPAESDPNGCALSDADLAILAADPERYATYLADVRAEYSHLSDDDFRAGRDAILADLLAAPSLFHTAHARAHWEAAARHNLATER